MPYSIDAVTDDCYEGTSCLINKFGITDQSILSKVEADISFAKTAELEKEPLPGVFDTEYYKKIHLFLFEDLYDWAGTFRKINISKKGTLFADHTKIEELSDGIFSRLKRLIKKTAEGVRFPSPALFFVPVAKTKNTSLIISLL